MIIGINCQVQIFFKKVKYCILTLSIFCFAVKQAHSQTKDSAIVFPVPRIIEESYKIIKIDSLQFNYIIYAKNKDSTIKIATRKAICSERHIKIGEIYLLKIQSLLDNTASKRHIGGIKFNGEIVRLEGEGVVWDLFYSQQFDGLCFRQN